MRARPRRLRAAGDRVRRQPPVPRRRAARARLDRRPARRARAGACWSSARSPSASPPGRATRSTAARACCARSRSSRPAATPSRAACSCRVPNVDSTLVAFTRRAGVAGARGRLAAGRRRPCARPSPTAARRSRTRSTLAGWREDRAAVEAACARGRRRSGRARRGAAAGDLRWHWRGPARRAWSPASRSTSACASGRGGPTATTSSRPCSRRCRSATRSSSSPPRRRTSRRRASPAAMRS